MKLFIVSTKKNETENGSWPQITAEKTDKNLEKLRTLEKNQSASSAKIRVQFMLCSAPEVHNRLTVLYNTIAREKRKNVQTKTKKFIGRR